MSIKWCRNCKSIGLLCANQMVPLGANRLAYFVKIAGAISVQIDIKKVQQENPGLFVHWKQGLGMGFA